MSEALRETGAGVIPAARVIEPPRRGHRDVTWHPPALARDERWTAIDQRGESVLLTGLPASGKSTIARALERRLVDAGQPAYVLDGDNIRHGLSDDLGFSPDDRAEHIRRVGDVALLMADCGTMALLSLISPMAAVDTAITGVKQAVAQIIEILRPAQGSRQRRRQ
jgi:bifunctional enzyme CysN/CysC